MHLAKIWLIICTKFFVVIGNYYPRDDIAKGDAENYPDRSFVTQISKCVSERIQIYQEVRHPEHHYEVCRNTYLKDIDGCRNGSSLACRRIFGESWNKTIIATESIPTPMMNFSITFTANESAMMAVWKESRKDAIFIVKINDTQAVKTEYVSLKQADVHFNVSVIPRIYVSKWNNQLGLRLNLTNNDGMWLKRMHHLPLNVFIYLKINKDSFIEVYRLATTPANESATDRSFNLPNRKIIEAGCGLMIFIDRFRIFNYSCGVLPVNVTAFIEFDIKTKQPTNYLCSGFFSKRMAECIVDVFPRTILRSALPSENEWNMDEKYFDPVLYLDILQQVYRGSPPYYFIKYYRDEGRLDRYNVERGSLNNLTLGQIFQKGRFAFTTYPRHIQYVTVRSLDDDQSPDESMVNSTELLQDPSKERLKLWTPIAGAILAFISFLIICSLIFFKNDGLRCLFKRCSKLESKNALGHYWVDRLKISPYYKGWFLEGSGRPKIAPIARSVDDFEVDPKYLEIDEKAKLGAGEFGAVYKGFLSQKTPVWDRIGLPNSKLDGDKLMVAVKMLPEIYSEEARPSFLEEIVLMKKLGYHERLVNILGCVTVTEPIRLIVEYCALGDLLRYLRKKKAYMIEKQNSDYVTPGSELIDENFMTVEKLLIIGWQVSTAMEYIGQNGFVHRDLAARNVLVDEDHNVKVCDFGLCRSLESDQLYYTSRGGKLPVKWMALESITEYKFTTATDVWSFGILLFELFTLGSVPYPGIDAKFMECYLKSGKRAAKPENCSDDLYDLMQLTWKESPQERPTFSQIKTKLQKMIENLKGCDYNYLTVTPENDYCNVKYGDDSSRTAESNVGDSTDEEATNFGC